MEYTGNIIYEVFTVMGNRKLAVTYQVEGSEDEYEITRIVISQYDTDQAHISFNLEEEMGEIMDQCIRDFVKQKELGTYEVKADLIKAEFFPKAMIPKELQFRLACKEYDFSAN